MNKTCFILFLLTVFACKAETPDTQNAPQKGEAIDGIRLAWDYSSMQRIAPANGRSLDWAGYPRVKKTTDGKILVTYETNGNIEMVQSTNNGTSWSDPVVVFKKHTVSGIDGESITINKANGEFIELQNGDWVMACNYRPQKDDTAPFSIAVKRSSDKGITWSEPQIIYQAGTRFSDGCWEPALLQLPTGELQVYFANEGPYTQSNEQEISMIASFDNGQIWEQEIKTVSFRAGRRDGMPVPLLLEEEIIVAIEDNNVSTFKPYLIRTSLANNWKTFVDASSTNRTYALKEKLPDDIYAGAPYLVRIPTGEVILSYQTTAHRSNNWELSTMEVAIGDKTGKNFEKRTNPFDVALNKEAKWNALALWDEHTICAASTTNFNSDHCEVWIIKGHIIPELKALKGSPVHDGSVSKEEWGEHFPVFVGHKGPVNLNASIRYDQSNLYLAINVKDLNIVTNPDNPNQSDGANIFIDAENQCLTKPDRGIYKISCMPNGEIHFFEGLNGQWNQQENNTIINKTSSNNNTYTMEVSIPLALLRKNNNNPIRLNIELNNIDTTLSGYRESIVHANPENPNTWCKLTFQ